MNKTISRIAKIGLVLMIMAGLWAPQPAMAASNIGESNEYAYIENAGWMNFMPTNGGVTVNATYLQAMPGRKTSGISNWEMIMAVPTTTPALPTGE